MVLNARTSLEFCKLPNSHFASFLLQNEGISENSLLSLPTKFEVEVANFVEIYTSLN